jgi:hypothetical protein
MVVKLEEEVDYYVGSHGGERCVLKSIRKTALNIGSGFKTLSSDSAKTHNSL